MHGAYHERRGGDRRLCAHLALHALFFHLHAPTCLHAFLLAAFLQSFLSFFGLSFFVLSFLSFLLLCMGKEVVGVQPSVAAFR